MTKLINKAFLFGALVATLCGAVGCADNSEAELKSASDFVYQMTNNTKITPVTYTVPHEIKTAYGLFAVEWAITVKDEANVDLVKVDATEKATNIKIDMSLMSKLEAPASYTLDYTISNEKGLSMSRTLLEKSIPNPKEATITQVLNKKASDTDFYKVEGVVTAQNKLDQKGPFTISDGTTTMYCHDGADQALSIGQKITLVCTRTDYSGFPQLKNAYVLGTPEAGHLSTVVNENTITEISYEDIFAKVALFNANATQTATGKECASKYYKITGGYLIKDSNDYFGLDSKPGVSSAKGVNIYYHTKDDLEGMVDQVVDLYGCCRGFGKSYITIQVTKCVPAGTPVTF